MSSIVSSWGHNYGIRGFGSKIYMY